MLLDMSINSITYMVTHLTIDTSWLASCDVYQPCSSALAHYRPVGTGPRRQFANGYDIQEQKERFGYMCGFELWLDAALLLESRNVHA